MVTRSPNKSKIPATLRLRAIEFGEPVIEPGSRTSLC
jgi:hypothetical protein